MRDQYERFDVSLVFSGRCSLQICVQSAIRISFAMALLILALNQTKVNQTGNDFDTHEVCERVNVCVNVCVTLFLF